MSRNTELATLGAGCFWGVEARFRELDGVLDATAGCMGGQGPDVGRQYRSVIFFHSESQQQIAALAIANLDASGCWNQPVVTQLVEAPEFWPAEEYPQRYLEKNGYGFCST